MILCAFSARLSLLPLFSPKVSEASSSPAMEAVGFRRGLDRLLDSGVSVDVVTTDRHPSIRKITREFYPNLRHEFDPWHVAKGIISCCSICVLFASYTIG